MDYPLSPSDDPNEGYPIPALYDMEGGMEERLRRADVLIQEVVRHECDEAARRGQAWTTPREFLPYEHIGAILCCMCQARGRGRVPAICVSYCVAFGGRLAYCAKCAVPRRAKTGQGEGRG